MIRIYSFFILFFSPLVSAQITVIDDSLFSPSLNSTTKYTIMLPSWYAESTERFPVLYLFH